MNRFNTEHLKLIAALHGAQALVEALYAQQPSLRDYLRTLYEECTVQLHRNWGEAQPLLDGALANEHFLINTWNTDRLSGYLVPERRAEWVTDILKLEKQANRSALRASLNPAELENIILAQFDPAGNLQDVETNFPLRHYASVWNLEFTRPGPLVQGQLEAEPILQFGLPGPQSSIQVPDLEPSAHAPILPTLLPQANGQYHHPDYQPSVFFQAQPTTDNYPLLVLHQNGHHYQPSHQPFGVRPMASSSLPAAHPPLIPSMNTLAQPSGPDGRNTVAGPVPHSQDQLEMINQLPLPPPATTPKQRKYCKVGDGAPPINIDFPDGELTACEILAFFPEWLQSVDVVQRLLYNGGMQGTFARIVKTFRNQPQKHADSLNNVLLKKMKKTMKAYHVACRPELPEAVAKAQMHGWTATEYHAARPPTWDADRISVTGFRTPRVTHPGKQPYLQNPVEPIPFKSLAENMLAWPAGADALNLTRCIDYHLRHPHEVWNFPTDFRKLIDHIGGPTSKTEQHLDRAAFARWTPQSRSQLVIVRDICQDQDAIDGKPLEKPLPDISSFTRLEKKPMVKKKNAFTPKTPKAPKTSKFSASEPKKDNPRPAKRSRLKDPAEAYVDGNASSQGHGGAAPASLPVYDTFTSRSYHQAAQLSVQGNVDQFTADQPQQQRTGRPCKRGHEDDDDEEGDVEYIRHDPAQRSTFPERRGTKRPADVNRDFLRVSKKLRTIASEALAMSPPPEKPSWKQIYPEYSPPQTVPDPLAPVYNVHGTQQTQPTRHPNYYGWSTPDAQQGDADCQLHQEQQQGSAQYDQNQGKQQGHAEYNQVPVIQQSFTHYQQQTEVQYQRQPDAQQGTAHHQHQGSQPHHQQQPVQQGLTANGQQTDGLAIDPQLLQPPQEGGTYAHLTPSNHPQISDQHWPQPSTQGVSENGFIDLTQDDSQGPANVDPNGFFNFEPVNMSSFFDFGEEPLPVFDDSQQYTQQYAQQPADNQPLATFEASE